VQNAHRARPNPIGVFSPSKIPALELDFQIIFGFFVAEPLVNVLLFNKIIKAFLK
jgi:hypothetical protein